MEIQSKDQLRAEYLAKRNTLSSSYAQKANKTITTRLIKLPDLEKTTKVLTYLSIGKEVDTAICINWLLSHNIVVSVPAYYEKEDVYRPVAFTGWKHLVKKKHVPQPDTLQLVDPLSIDVAIVPGVVFDVKGNRIGYGRGHFDRLLATVSTSCLKIGLVYAFQVVPKIPSEAHDITMDYIVTETEIYNTKKRK